MICSWVIAGYHDVWPFLLGSKLSLLYCSYFGFFRTRSPILKDLGLALLLKYCYVFLSWDATLISASVLTSSNRSRFTCSFLLFASTSRLSLLWLGCGLATPPQLVSLLHSHMLRRHVFRPSKFLSLSYIPTKSQEAHLPTPLFSHLLSSLVACVSIASIVTSHGKVSSCFTEASDANRSAF